MNTFTSQQSMQEMMQRLNAYLNMLAKLRLLPIDSDGSSSSDKDGDGSTVVAACLWEMRHGSKATEWSQIQAEQQSMPSNRTATLRRRHSQRRADSTKASDNLGDALSAFGESDVLRHLSSRQKKQTIDSDASTAAAQRSGLERTPTRPDTRQRQLGPARRTSWRWRATDNHDAHRRVSGRA